MSVLRQPGRGRDHEGLEARRTEQGTVRTTFHAKEGNGTHGTHGTKKPNAEAVLIFMERGNGLASRRDAELAEDWDLWGRVSPKSRVQLDARESERPHSGSALSAALREVSHLRISALSALRRRS